MLPSKEHLRRVLGEVIVAKAAQGYVTAGLNKKLARLPDRYDALGDFAQRLEQLDLRADWPYLEPEAWPKIVAQMDRDRPLGPMAEINPKRVAPRVEAAFLSSVAGCILGKPLEVNPTLAEIRAAAEKAGVWPLDDYVPGAMIDAMPRAHGSRATCAREAIRFVAPDDDINYTILGMLVLERHGIGFAPANLRSLWLENLPIGMTFGPERKVLLDAGQWSWSGIAGEPPYADWVRLFNPKDEYCGALIRADAYGYACPGYPALAAELAFRDASFTHRRTGVYGTMYVAAAIAVAFTRPRDPLEIFATAQRFIPRQSRLHEIADDCLSIVADAKDWLDAYERIHFKYDEFCHCRIYQEIGTMINTLRFAQDIGDGICKQVAQGNDTDSFGATCGSILGAYFGRGGLEDRWLAPFNDDLRTTVADFHEGSLSAVAERMGKLPAIIKPQWQLRDDVRKQKK
ncbi:MAG: hypothetical protein BIFFINMI_03491 [Phycisphaerae bacterium]|nr:hypothetical protein [Phycisphaerae bacterium]